MAANRQISKLKNMAFEALKKSQTDFLRTNGFFSSDNFVISLKANEQAAADIVTRVSLTIFLQAVIEDDVVIVKKCLDAEPELLLEKPDDDLVIENHLTWQKFYAESALMMAVKLKQIKMIRLLLSYYDKLPQTVDIIKSRTEALSAWKLYTLENHFVMGVDMVVIPSEYAAYVQSLIDVFKEETFPNGVPGVNDVRLNVLLNEKTELALSFLLNLLVPKNAVKLDEHIDVELLLLVIFDVYDLDLDLFFNNDVNRVYPICTRVMGLNQSALTPETGSLVCDGLFGVMQAIEKGKERELGAEALLHKLKDGKALHRTGRESRVGAGFEFWCDVQGTAETQAMFISARSLQIRLFWENYLKQKQQAFEILRSRYNTTQPSLRI
jgi:hypothetical protein